MSASSRSADWRWPRGSCTDRRASCSGSSPPWSPRWRSRWAMGARQLAGALARRSMRARLAAAAGAVGDGVDEALRLLRTRDPTILIGAAGYMLFDVAMLGVCFAAFGNDVPPAGVLLVAYIIGQLGSLIPIPGGIGGVDAGLIGTLVLYGVDATDAAAAVIAYRGLLLAIPALLGLPLARRPAPPAARRSARHRRLRARGNGRSARPRHRPATRTRHTRRPLRRRRLRRRPNIGSSTQHQLQSISGSTERMLARRKRKGRSPVRPRMPFPGRAPHRDAPCDLAPHGSPGRFSGRVARRTREQRRARRAVAPCWREAARCPKRGRAGRGRRAVASTSDNSDNRGVPGSSPGLATPEGRNPAWELDLLIVGGVANGLVSRVHETVVVPPYRVAGGVASRNACNNAILVPPLAGCLPRL
jgi:Lysylphosphatidylglycerol synthase TM region